VSIKGRWSRLSDLEPALDERVHRVRHSFPTRRSSDLSASAGAWEVTATRSPIGQRTSLRRGASPRGRTGASRGSSRRGRTTERRDRKSTRLNSSHVKSSYAVFWLDKRIDDILRPT